MTVAMVLPPVAGSLSRCDVGRLVVDDGGTQGQIIGDGGKECLVKSADGRFLIWLPIAQLGTATAQTPTPPATALTPATPAPKDEKVRVLRPMELDRTITFPADALGHILLLANVNGTPLRFLVDTGATLVALTPADAESAGIHQAN